MRFFLLGARRHTPREEYVEVTTALCDACHVTGIDEGDSWVTFPEKSRLWAVF